MSEYIFESPRQFAKRKILSERQTRQLIEQGKVPGIYTAKGYKINVVLFLEQLNTLCMNGGAVL